MKEVANVTEVELYTDGSSRGNPGPGGYGVVLRFYDAAGQVHEKELSQGYASTTNNRMELLAAITGLEALNRACKVTLYSDSQYLVKAFNDKWIDGWVSRGWKNAKKEPVANRDLWERLVRDVSLHEVCFVWVRGHDGHPENERCDALATAAADGKNGALIEDAGFIAETLSNTLL